MAGQTGQHGTSVRAPGDATAFELVEIAPRCHRRDLELDFEARDRDAALLP